MRHFIGLMVILFTSFQAFSQNTKPLQEPAFGIVFFFTDFNTPAFIRAGSVSETVRNNRFARLSEMSPGLSLTYFRGIAPKVAFSSTLAGSFMNYPLPSRTSRSSESFLLEGDVSLQAKMFPDRFWFNPYLQAGLGISKFAGYWGAFMPAGTGIQINFFEEAYLLLNAQYRIPVSPTVRGHFFFSLGIAGSFL